MKQILSITKTVLYESKIDHATVRTLVEEATKTRANLNGANLARADLNGADLNGANLTRADLARADLARANLNGANLNGANLNGANLTRADLARANLNGANLNGANLTRADLARAKGISVDRSDNLRMLREQPSTIRAYKLVDEDYKGPHYPGESYEIGKTYEVEDADTDETVQCARGINVADMVWILANWQEGYHVLVVEFLAADIAAIPIGTDGKFRLHRCKIVGEKDIREMMP